MLRARFLVVCCAMAASVTVVVSVPNFIVMPAETTEVSRNEVKEEFGNSLHALVKVITQVQKAVGKTTMVFGALLEAAADQAAALVEDSEPFNTASTGKLARSSDVLQKEVEEFQKLLASIEELTIRATKTARLE
ncbi:MAG: hypothetical protein QG604_464 [Candidatus Dependentiae bacterium]|nr:hypothetical protein [Candidatus Dependentiae bacterium]